jgi:hypothetical protein
MILRIGCRPLVIHIVAPLIDKTALTSSKPCFDSDDDEYWSFDVFSCILDTCLSKVGKINRANSMMKPVPSLRLLVQSAILLFCCFCLTDSWSRPKWLKCPHNCNYQGVCLRNNTCDCHAGFTGPDCSLRKHPFSSFACYGLSLRHNRDMSVWHIMGC